MFCAGLCLVLGAILMPVGIIGFWGKQTVTNPDTFSTVVSDTVSNPVVEEEIATWATDEIVGFIEQSDVLESAPQIQALITKFGFSLKPFIYPLVLNMVQSETGHAVLANVINTAQSAVLSILEGNDPPGTAIRDGQVVVDFNSLTDAIKQALADRGIKLPEQLKQASSIEIPRDLADNIPDSVRDRLNSATDGAVDKANDSLNNAQENLNSARTDAQQKADSINEQLNSNQIVLMNKDQLDQVRAIYALTVPIATWLIVISLVLFAGAIALSTNRRRMVLLTGILWVLAAVIVYLAIAIGENQLTNAFDGSIFESGSEVFYGLLIHNLRVGATIIGVLGLIIIAACLVRNFLAKRKAAQVPPIESGQAAPQPEPVTAAAAAAPDSGETATDDPPTTA